QRLGLLAVGERALEGRLGLLPRTAGQRFESRGEAAVCRDAADDRGRRGLERGILVEDQSLQLAQLEGWVEAEIVVQPAAEVVVDRKRIGVPAAAVERGHRIAAAGPG